MWGVQAADHMSNSSGIQNSDGTLNTSQNHSASAMTQTNATMMQDGEETPTTDPTTDPLGTSHVQFSGMSTSSLDYLLMQVDQVVTSTSRLSNQVQHLTDLGAAVTTIASAMSREVAKNQDMVKGLKDDLDSHVQSSQADRTILKQELHEQKQENDHLRRKIEELLKSQHQGPMKGGFASPSPNSPPPNLIPLSASDSAGSCFTSPEPESFGSPDMVGSIRDFPRNAHPTNQSCAEVQPTEFVLLKPEEEIESKHNDTAAEEVNNAPGEFSSENLLLDEENQGQGIIKSDNESEGPLFTFDGEAGTASQKGTQNEEETKLLIEERSGSAIESKSSLNKCAEKQKNAQNGEGSVLLFIAEGSNEGESEESSRKRPDGTDILCPDATHQEVNMETSGPKTIHHEENMQSGQETENTKTEVKTNGSVGHQNETSVEVLALTPEAQARVAFWKSERDHEERYSFNIFDLMVRDCARQLCRDCGSDFNISSLVEACEKDTRFMSIMVDLYKMFYGHRTAGTCKIVPEAEAYVGRFGKVLDWDEQSNMYSVELIPTKTEKIARSKGKDVVTISPAHLELGTAQSSKKKKSKKGKRASQKNTPTEHTVDIPVHVTNSHGDLRIFQAFITVSKWDLDNLAALEGRERRSLLKHIMAAKSAEEACEESEKLRETQMKKLADQQSKLTSYIKQIDKQRKVAKRIRESDSKEDQSFLTKVNEVFDDSICNVYDDNENKIDYEGEPSVNELFRLAVRGVRDFYLGEYYRSKKIGWADWNRLLEEKHKSFPKIWLDGLRFAGTMPVEAYIGYSFDHLETYLRDAHIGGIFCLIQHGFETPSTGKLRVFCFYGRHPIAYLTTESKSFEKIEESLGLASNASCKDLHQREILIRRELFIRRTKKAFEKALRIRSIKETWHNMDAICSVANEVGLGRSVNPMVLVDGLCDQGIMMTKSIGDDKHYAFVDS